jgi:hypothetical protein
MNGKAEMRSSTWFLVLALIATGGYAATVDMNDPRRAVGSEDDVRVDAQLTSEFVSPNSPVSVTYQIQNLSSRSVAVAGGLCEASYDRDSRTITLSVGSEVPRDGEMPRLVTISPGEKRTFIVGAVLRVNVPSMRTPLTSVPAFVQIKVNVLRDVAPFVALINRQRSASAAIALSDDQFDQWLKTNESIFLNVIPVRFRAAEPSRVADASQR